MGKIFQRIIDFVYGILLIGIVIINNTHKSLFFNFNILSPQQLHIALQIIQVSIGLSLAYRIFKNQKSCKNLIITKENGMISISNTAIQDFIIKFLLRYDAISEVNCKVKLYKSKVTVQIQMHLDKVYRSSEFLQTLKNHLKKELLAIIGHQNKIIITYHINKIDLTRSELLQEIKPVLYNIDDTHQKQSINDSQSDL